MLVGSGRAIGRRVVRPRRTGVDPMAKRSNLGKAERLATKGHPLFTALAEHPVQEAALSAIARHYDRSGDTAFHRQGLRIKPPLARSFRASVAAEARRPEDTLYVALGIHARASD